MSEFRVANASTISEPRATGTATTVCARFLYDAAFGAHGSDIARCDPYVRVLVRDTHRKRTTVSDYR